MKRLWTLVLTMTLLMGIHVRAKDFGECFVSPECIAVRNDVGTLKADGKSVTFTYKTIERKGTQYQISRVTFPTPVNMVGKTLLFNLSFGQKSEDAILCVALRFNNYLGEKDGKPQYEEESCLSYLHWGQEALTQTQTVSLHPAACSPYDFHFQPDRCQNRIPDRVGYCEIYLGSVTPNVTIEAVMSDFRLMDKPQPVAPAYEKPFEILWNRTPVYSDKPAKVHHPVGAYKADDIARAKENYRRYEWAKNAAEQLRRWGEFWLNKDEEAIRFWIPEDDCWFKCLCPNCGTQPEFAWRGSNVLQPDGLHIKCTKCGMVFPNDQYPETSTYTIKTVHGKTKTIKYYHGKDQIAQNENYGSRYHLSGEVNRLRFVQVSRIVSLARWYAITGETECAAKVRQVLLRVAEVYPNYSVKFRATAYETPRDNYMGGKVAAWKFTDSSLMPNVLEAYSLTYNSGLYSDEDKVKIENGIAREIKWLYTAWPPTKDTCSNAVPAHMHLCALAAAILGDHEFMDWVMKGTEGFPAFIRKHYERDGHWHEHTPSYGGMATSPIIPLVRVLQGYHDADDYNGPNRYNSLDAFAMIPELDLVFTGYAAGVLPTMTYPATNDSTASCAPSLIWLQLAVDKAPNERNIALLDYISERYGRKAAPGQNALFYQSPDFKAAPKGTVPAAASEPRIFPGGGWVMLRRPASFRESCAMVMTTGRKSHEHNSTLGLTYHDFGMDASSDLGYLSAWHPYANWLRSPLAHNLVMVNGKYQAAARMGFNELFSGTTDIIASRTIAKRIYRRVKRYERTVFNLPLANGKRQYLADFFLVDGGDSHLWAFHADGEEFLPPASISLKPASADALEVVNEASKWFYGITSAPLSAGSHLFTWKQERLTTRSYLLTDTDATLFHAEGLALRTQLTPYDEPKLHIALLKRPGPENIFAQVIESDQGAPFVKDARLMSSQSASPAKAVKVVTAEGTDYIAIGNGPLSLPDEPRFKMEARSGVVRLDANGRLASLWVEGGTILWDGHSLSAPGLIEATVQEVAPHEIVVETASWPDNLDIHGMYLSVIDQHDGAYRMIQATKEGASKVKITLDPYEVNRITPKQIIQIFPYAEKKFAK